MKKGIHPKYNPKVVITCNSCKTKHIFGSVLSEDSHVEVCSNCHPFYTGKQNILVDTDSRIEDYNKRLANSDQTKVIKKRKKVLKRKAKTTEITAGPKITLSDMIKEVTK